MKIHITNPDTGKTTIYDYSKNNWKRQYACMHNSLVIMWAPKECRLGVKIKTSGLIWEVKE